MKQTLGVCWNE